MTRNKQYLGHTKPGHGRKERFYLEDFEWACGWYWSGGFISSEHSMFRFDGAFLETPDQRGHPLGNFVTPWQKSDYPNTVIIENGCSIWEPITTFLDDVPEHLTDNWWRIKDLYRQFYRLRDAAEVFRHGGNCTPQRRRPQEIKPIMADSINSHIEHVIIPAIREVVFQ